MFAVKIPYTTKDGEQKEGTLEFLNSGFIRQCIVGDSFLDIVNRTANGKPVFCNFKNPKPFLETTIELWIYYIAGKFSLGFYQGNQYVGSRVHHTVDDKETVKQIKAWMKKHYRKKTK